MAYDLVVSGRATLGPSVRLSTYPDVEYDAGCYPARPDLLAARLA
jgi:hypothetical protein